METQDKRELISALMDGQVDAARLEAAVRLAASDPQARQAWDRYHLIGDVMRSGELASVASSSDFLARLHQRLPEGDVVTPPAAQRPPVPERAAVRPAGTGVREAANDSGAGWRWAAGFASLAAVGAVVWGLASPQAGRDAPQAQMAAVGASAAANQAAPAGVPAALPVAIGGEVMLRDPRLDELMAAHRQLGGATALQMPAGFLRNATFEAPSREGR